MSRKCLFISLIIHILFFTLMFFLKSDNNSKTGQKGFDVVLDFTVPRQLPKTTDNVKYLELNKKIGPTIIQRIEKPKTLSKKIEKPKTLPKKIEKPKTLPKKIEKPKTLPKKIEKPKTLPKKIEKPKIFPKKTEKPKTLPKKTEKPKTLPKKIDKSKTLPKKIEKPKIFPKKTEKPKTLPKKTEKPKTLPKKIDKSKIFPKKTVESRTSSITKGGANKAGNIYALSNVEKIRLRNQVKQCWSNIFHIFFNQDQDLKIRVKAKVRLSIDGEVQSVSILEGSKSYPQNQDLYKSISNSIHRAFADIRCNKFNLPKRKYKNWKELTFIFDPADL